MRFLHHLLQQKVADGKIRHFQSLQKRKSLPQTKMRKKASHLNEPLPGQLGDPIFSVVNRGLRSNVNVVVLVLVVVVVVVNVVVVFVGIFESWPRPDSNSIKLILPVTGEKCNANVN